MSFRIDWSAEAEETFNSNLNYLEKDWNQQVIDNFTYRVKEILVKIQSDPHLFPNYQFNSNIHKCIVTEQITLYYEVMDGSTIKLITFWNVYQNPKKLKLK